MDIYKIIPRTHYIICVLHNKAKSFYVSRTVWSREFTPQKMFQNYVATPFTTEENKCLTLLRVHT
jgi:hypothetical protein